MAADNVKIKYHGSALPGNAETVTIFDTTDGLAGTGASQMPANFMALAQLNRLYLALVNDQAGTLKSYSSEDRGKTWTQIGSLAVSAVAANSENPSDWLIESYSDWRLLWVNGATPQTTFRVAAALQGQRNPGA